ncbi:hypothetical protein Nepgr_023099 [Nepenthes gracilis]|uniref:Uncharacterized protein n=1 Tax=Nepenthes gracilis TaxID=150966 RepID=A0AAD3T391_NEPGR|nr:hypothetical protein Nepgr_023099 [Nepenthes gracilis]
MPSRTRVTPALDVPSPQIQNGHNSKSAVVHQCQPGQNQTGIKIGILMLRHLQDSNRSTTTSKSHRSSRVLLLSKQRGNNKVVKATASSRQNPTTPDAGELLLHLTRATASFHQGDHLDLFQAAHESATRTKYATVSVDVKQHPPSPANHFISLPIP